MTEKGGYRTDIEGGLAEKGGFRQRSKEI
jgi:hypothetical protein